MKVLNFRLLSVPTPASVFFVHCAMKNFKKQAEIVEIMLLNSFFTIDSPKKIKWIVALLKAFFLTISSAQSNFELDYTALYRSDTTNLQTFV